MERTLSIIKPDGVQRGLIGEVVKRLEKNELRIVAMKMIHMTKDQARGFYAVHRERPFFESLTDFMSSGPAVVMVLEGENVIAPPPFGPMTFRSSPTGPKPNCASVITRA